MNLLDLSIRIRANDEASSKLDGISTSAIAKATAMGNAFYDATKFVAGKAVDMAQSVIGGAVQGYASYEQLAGGVEKLYGDSSGLIKQYAQDAYKTAGMSANQYMEQATGFSASLIKSLGGDTEAAAKLTDVAMRTMSDNVNVFGSDMESVQNAFQGFAKDNFTMLDNLKMGYSGTREGAQELIKDAAAATESQEKLGLTVDANSLSFDNMVKAIAVMEEEQNIWGTTTREAMGTIEGSWNAAKASWDNLITALGSGDQDMIQNSVTHLVDSIFGTFSEETQKREGGLINNVVPVVEHVADAVVNVLPQLAEGVATTAIDAFNQHFGTSFDAEGIVSAFEEAFTEAKERVQKVLDAILDAIDGFMSTVDMDKLSDALDSLKKVADDLWGFVEDNILPNLPTLGEVLGTVANVILDAADAVLKLIDIASPVLPAILGAVAALSALSAITGVISAVSGAFTILTTVILPALGAVQSFGGAIALVTTLLGGPITIIAALVGAIVAFILTNEDARNAILNAWNAVVEFFSGLPEWFSGVWESIKAGISEWVDSVIEFWTSLLDNTKKIWEAIKTAVVTFVLQLVEQALTGFTVMKEKALQIWDAMKEAVSNIAQGLRDAVVNIWTAIKTKVTELVNGLKSSVQNAWNNLKSAVEGTVNGLKSAVDSAWSAIKNFVTNAANNARDAAVSAFESLKSGVSSRIDGVLGYVRNLPGNIVSALGNLGSLLWNAGSSIISGLWDGMIDAAESMLSWVSGIADRIASLKGPLPYDRKVLVDNGLALMYGLRKGIEEGFEKQVEPYVSGLAMDMSTSFSAEQAGGVDAAPSGAVVQVGELVVREESDIYRIAEQLNDLINRQGGGTWSTSYSMA